MTSEDTVKHTYKAEFNTTLTLKDTIKHKYKGEFNTILTLEDTLISLIGHKQKDGIVLFCSILF